MFLCFPLHLYITGSDSTFYRTSLSSYPHRSRGSHLKDVHLHCNQHTNIMTYSEYSKNCSIPILFDIVGMKMWRLVWRLGAFYKHQITSCTQMENVNTPLTRFWFRVHKQGRWGKVKHLTYVPKVSLETPLLTHTECPINLMQYFWHLYILELVLWHNTHR